MSAQDESDSKSAQPEYPGGVPGKFDKNGNVQPFAGNTIVCHLANPSKLYTSLLGLHEKLRTSHLSHLYTLLPPPSWHMTVFEGVCNQVRKPEYWPSDLPLDTPLADCTAHFAAKLERFDLRDDRPYQMCVRGMDPLETGMGIHLEPRTAVEGARLRSVRNRLAEALDLRHPGHESYGLHFSIAYLLRHLSEEQKAELSGLVLDHLEDAPVEFELGVPEFCTFEDMFAFKRQFYLAKQ